MITVWFSTDSPQYPTQSCRATWTWAPRQQVSIQMRVWRVYFLVIWRPVSIHLLEILIWKRSARRGIRLWVLSCHRYVSCKEGPGRRWWGSQNRSKNRIKSLCIYITNDALRLINARSINALTKRYWFFTHWYNNIHWLTRKKETLSECKYNRTCINYYQIYTT